MTYAVRYYTKSGNTEKLAKAIEEQTGIPALTVESDLEDKTDVLLLGCSYYAFDMDPVVKAFITVNRDKIGQIVLFGTSAMIKSMKKPLAKVVDGLAISIAEEEFHCPGSFGPMHKGRPNADDLKAVKEFAAKIVK
ncbi:MAG: flavodoxin [Lachnospiraceae bacterium]|nr:flavodoxin [Lachnospiraceae bacterium]